MPWPTSFVVKNGSKAFAFTSGGHAAAVIGDRQHDILARQRPRLRGGIAFVEMDIGGFDGELAAVSASRRAH